ncbi:Rha family transcriptional regulator [Cohnella sp.]|uniref:Rha family transcriptional regulator n=1 Tax=Cohnella sp. TaxID=1883426 RepID=UPI00356683DE
MNQLVFIENNRPVTDSLTVAEAFGKEHKNVLRDIESLECSPEFSRLNFEQSTYTNDRGRTYPKYLMTQDGFSFLVMGYTGKEAAKFKEMYISEFNQMRAEIEKPDPQRLIAIALIEAGKLLEAKDAQIALLEPKAAFFDAVADSKSAIDMAQAAKVLDYGKGRTTLFRILRDRGVLRANNEPYQEYIDRGYFRVVEQKYNKPDGSTHIHIKTLVYQKGLEYIRRLLKES